MTPKGVCTLLTWGVYGPMYVWMISWVTLCDCPCYLVHSHDSGTAYYHIDGCSHCGDKWLGFPLPQKNTMKWELCQHHYSSALVSVTSTHTDVLYTTLYPQIFPAVRLEIKGCVPRKKRFFLNCCVILCSDPAVITKGKKGSDSPYVCHIQHSAI